MSDRNRVGAMLEPVLNAARPAVLHPNLKPAIRPLSRPGGREAAAGPITLDHEAHPDAAEYLPCPGLRMRTAAASILVSVSVDIGRA
jgi:hypothetical protein